MTLSSSKNSSNRKQPKVAPRVIRIMVFGTFDVLHPGHDHFLKQARAKAKPAKAFLIASLARDRNVKRIKGRLPLYNENRRLKELKSHPLVDKAVLGSLGDHIPHIVKQKPDIIALGYDQNNYVAGLRSALKQKGLTVKIIRLKAHKPTKYKSSLIKRGRV